MATVLWFTGLSGSGKSTIANGLKEKLMAIGKKVILFDGDTVRDTLHKHLGFTREDIRENNRLIAELAVGHVVEYDFIITPIISPYREDRQAARQKIGPDFVEVYVNCPLEECVARDTKGLYAKAASGELTNLIGVSVSNPYEAPLNPEIEIKTTGESPDESIKKLLAFLEASGRL